MIIFEHINKIYKYNKNECNQQTINKIYKYNKNECNQQTNNK